MCTSLGSWYGYICMGAMVDRLCVGSYNLFSSDICNVSHVISWILYLVIGPSLQTVLIIISLLTFICRMSNQRSELAEMTALYLIPIVSVVIAATSGGLVAGAIPNRDHQLWTLIICYILWGIGSPLSWIILTLYFLRMTIHKPLKREVIVSLLLPIGPLGLSGFS